MVALPAESGLLRERIRRWLPRHAPRARVGNLAGVEESYYVVLSRWRVPEGS